MENTNGTQKVTIVDAIGMVANNLGNISFPASVLAVLSPEQIIVVKQAVIDPVELARRNLFEILNAYKMAAQQAEQERARQTEQDSEDEKETTHTGEEEVNGNGTKNNHTECGEVKENGAEVSAE